MPSPTWLAEGVRLDDGKIHLDPTGERRYVIKYRGHVDGKSAASAVVREIRRRAGLSQRALGTMAGVPQPTIAEIKAGRREPSVTLLGRLAEATGHELTLELQPLPPRGAVSTANRVRQLLGGDGSEAFREDAALRAVIDLKDALRAAGADGFNRLVWTPPGRATPAGMHSSQR